MNKNRVKYIILSLVFILTVSLYSFDLQSFFTLDYIKENYEGLKSAYNNQPLSFGFRFFIVYLLVAAIPLPIPGVVLLSLLAGAIFGIRDGFIIVSFASTLGATIVFLMSRFLFCEIIQKKFKKQLASVNEGMKKNEVSYILGLRLAPVFPFFLINILMGVTKVSTPRYYILSQIGMLPGTLVIVFAGLSIGNIESVKDIFSPQIITSFFLMSTFPFLAKLILTKFKK